MVFAFPVGNPAKEKRQQKPVDSLEAGRRVRNYHVEDL